MMSMPRLRVSITRLSRASEKARALAVRVREARRAPKRRRDEIIMTLLLHVCKAPTAFVEVLVQRWQPASAAVGAATADTSP